MTYDLVVGIAGNLLFFCAGVGAKILIDFFHRRHIRLVFGAFRAGGVVRVVLSTRPGPKPGSTERVSLSETMAFAAVQRVLAQIGIATLPCGANVPLRELSDSNLIVFGGPAANNFTEQLWSNSSVGVPYRIDATKYVLRAVPNDFVPEIDADGRVMSDYGLLLRLASPLNSGRPMILAAGCHGYGTEGCVMMLTQMAHIKTLAERTKDRDFAAVIKVTIKDRQIFSIRIVECVILT